MLIKKLNESYGKIIENEDRHIARNILSCEVPNKYYIKLVREGKWDGVYRFMNNLTGNFPLGLIHLLPNAKIINDAPLMEPIQPKIRGIEFRDYQLEAFLAILKNYRGILHMATGSGKTEIMAGVLSMFYDDTACILLHRIELLEQTVERFSEALQEEVGTIGSGTHETDKRVTVAMVQTLSSKKYKEDFKHILKSKILMLDECHRASAKTWYDLSLKFTKAEVRIGVSGTPTHSTDLAAMRLMSITGDVIYTKKSKTLIKEGYLSKVEIKVVDYGAKEFSPEFPKYAEVYDEKIVNNYSRNYSIVQQAKQETLKNNKKTLIVVTSIEHGRNIQEIFGDYGFNIPFTSGKENKKYRRSILKKFKEGKEKILIASTILDEGIDVPDIDCVIMAAGGKSPIRLLQRIGRGIRKAKGKEKLTVIDFVDRGKYIGNHFLERLDLYKKEGFPIKKEKK